MENLIYAAQMVTAFLFSYITIVCIQSMASRRLINNQKTTWINRLLFFGESLFALGILFILVVKMKIS